MVAEVCIELLRVEIDANYIRCCRPDEHIDRANPAQGVDCDFSTRVNEGSG